MTSKTKALVRLAVITVLAAAATAGHDAMEKGATWSELPHYMANGAIAGVLLLLKSGFGQEDPPKPQDPPAAP